MKWMSIWAALAVGGCSPNAAVCGWVGYIQPDPGFEERWTLDEKRQVLQHNLKVEEFCRA